MYESRFGITAPPFQLSPDPSFYFDSRGHHAALAELRRGLAEESGFIVVSGEVGAGKTTLVRTLLAESDPQLMVVAQLVSTQLDADELLRAVLIAFGAKARSGSREELSAAFHRFLAKLYKDVRRAVLIVDEAQNLRPDAFDELLLLAGSTTRLRAPFQVCLVGQPELRGMLESNELRHLRRLTSVTCHLGPIDRSETGAYIEHRLHKVGWSGVPSFAPGAFDEIFDCTKGIPRRINALCNRLLMSMFLNSQTEIVAAAVAQAARDLVAEIGEPAALPPAAATAPIPVLFDEVQPEFPAAIDPGGLLCVVAGNADHVQAAPLMHALAARPELPAATLVRLYPNDGWQAAHTLFDGLDTAQRLINVGGVESAGEAPDADLLDRLERVMARTRPRAVFAFGGSSAALACGLVAARNQVAFVHIGAGLRADSAAAAAESARKRTDALADLLYTAQAEASDNLVLEGLPRERIQCVGNLLADALRLALQPSPDDSSAYAEGFDVAQQEGADWRGHALVVLNKPVNVGNRQTLLDLVAILRDVSRDVPLVWPMRSFVREQLSKFRLDGFIAAERIVCLPVQGYPEFAALLQTATCVLTDSWSVQDEASVLEIPCLTLGLHPDRKASPGKRSSTPVGTNRTLATRAVWQCIFDGGKRGPVPALWDGDAAGRIAGHLSTWLRMQKVD